MTDPFSHDWLKHGWNTEDASKNYFTPDGFEASVRAALATADEYVWIYTETPRWRSDEGGALKLPPAYAEALHRARLRRRGLYHQGVMAAVPLRG